jgi:hypothetical protein
MSGKASKSANARAIVYWTSTILIAASFLSGGIANVMHAEQAVAGMIRLGYPLHFMNILGVWKILGACAILAPRLPRLKEWAYAGMIFDLTGAAVAHASVRDADATMGSTGHILAPLGLALLVVVSWALRPQARTVAEPLTPDLVEPA